MENCNSNSSSDSECFESAEESLDECEENSIDNNPKKFYKLKESEIGIVEPVALFEDTLSSTSGHEENNALTNFAYRKRPERIKLAHSNPSSKNNVTKKSAVKESVLKTEKIARDKFFSDITNNFSKNINKSLNSLQQTSSNVKDLILNSLPVASSDEKNSFSYDDKKKVSQIILGESNDKTIKLSKSEACIPSNNLDEEIKNVSSKNSEKVETTDKNILTRKKANILKIGKACMERDGNEESKLIVEKTRNESSETSDDSFLGLKTGFKSKSEQNKLFDPDYEKDIDKCWGKEMEEEFNVKKFSTDILKIDQDMPHGEEDDFILEKSEEKNNLKENMVNDKMGKNFLNEIENKKVQNFNLDLSVSNKSENCSKNDSSNNENVKDDLHLFESKQMGCISNSAVQSIIENVNEKQESETNSECNLEELKAVLKEMVPNTTENEKTEEKKFICPPNFNPSQGNIEIESTKDGWDDFDFSDDEIVDSKIGESTLNKGKNDVNTDKNNQIEVIDKENNGYKKKKENSNFEIQNKNLENEFPLSDTTYVTLKNNVEDLNFKEINSDKKKVQIDYKKNISNLKNSGDTESSFSDDWEWNSWDDNYESKKDEKQIKVLTGSQEVEKTSLEKDDFFNENRWSEWDTFGEKKEEKMGNWNIGAWGVNMLLNKATAVTQGISNVLEAGLGAPDPETLARMESLNKEVREHSKIEEESLMEVSKKNSPTDGNLVFGLTSLVAGMTSKIVEHSKIQEIGNKVIAGGLDTLETFGKKTMEVLQEGDPGLRNKRALFLGDRKPTLSQVLKEAREKADKDFKKLKEIEASRKCHFESLFDDFQGMIHLEALEMLSRQCELKLEQIRTSMSLEDQEDLTKILEEVEQLCCLDDSDINFSSNIDFKISLKMAIEQLKQEISEKQIIQIHDTIEDWLEVSYKVEPSMTVLHQKAVSTLAELTAATIHQFHKAGELLSVKECRKTVQEIEALSRMTNVLCAEISKLSEKFIQLSKNISTKESSSENFVIEKVENTMKNSIFYLKQAFNLLIPIVQVGAAVY